MRSGSQLIVAATLIALSNGISAASQGDFGRESASVSRITLVINPSVRISGVDDIVINVNQRDKDALHTEEICIRSNSGASYFVTANTGSASGSQFMLHNVQNQSIEFEMLYRSNLNTQNGETLRPNIRSRLHASGQASGSCDGGDTAALDLRFPADHLSNSPPGVYSGLLTLTVAAE